MSAAIKRARANYQGDRGYARAMPGTGYAMGDPGLFGSIFGGIKKLARTAISTMPGGGIALGLAGAAKTLLTRQRRAARDIGTLRGRQQLLPAAAFQQYQGPPAQAVQPVPGFRGLMERIIPGGATGLQVPGEAIGARVPQGYHLNKSGYYRGGRPGSASSSVEWIPEESIFVKNRKRNPMNPRAWDRAFGRLKSAQNLKKKMGRITIREVC